MWKCDTSVLWDKMAIPVSFIFDFEFVCCLKNLCFSGFNTQVALRD